MNGVRRRQRQSLDLRVAFVVFVLLAATEAAAVPRRAVRLNREANRAYDDAKWPEAASLYDEAQGAAPESPEIAYNLGNALYRQGKTGDAAAHLRRAAEASDPVLKQKSLYNLGNALHDLGELQMAAKAYREALRLDPRDRDAKINFEKTMQELQKSGGKKDKQQQNQSQQNQDKGQQGQNQQQQDNQGQGQNSDEQQSSEGQEQQGGEDSRQADQQSPPQDPGSSEQQPAPQPGEESEQMAALDSVPGGLTREEALRILEAMREQEKELQQQRARKMQARSRRVDKDW
jgi:tetratricopeptide (TPR) repeat protein